VRNLLKKKMKPKKKKIVHVTSSLRIGGAEAVLCDLIKGLGNEQFEHHVIYFHRGRREQQVRQLGVQTYQIRGLFSLYDPVFFYRLWKLIRLLKPDVIHSLLWSANVSSRLVAQLLSIPHVSVYHNNIDQDGRLRNLLDKATRIISERLVAVSDEVAESIVKTDLRFSKKKIIVIKNGVDADEVREKAEHERVSRDILGLPEKCFVIGSVGRFCPVKNYPLLISAFASLVIKSDQAYLVLVGVGPDEEALREQVRKLKIEDRVIFIIGRSSYGYFSLFDCFVQSSDKEGISIALLEAMSCGIPCVATHVDSCHSVLVSGKNGLVVKAGKIQDLLDAIRRLEEDYTLARRLGQEGKKFVDIEFGLERMVQNYKDVFDF